MLYYNLTGIFPKILPENNSHQGHDNGERVPIGPRMFPIGARRWVRFD